MTQKGIKKARQELQIAFGFALGVGILILFFLQFYFESNRGEVNNEPIWAIAFGPLLPMLGYIIFGLQLEKQHQDARGFADSTYYFGFILTLTSLVLATFWERLNDPDVTLGYFGAALTTTLFGIAFRTYHTQFLYEKEDDFLPRGERERIVGNVDEFVSGVTGLNHQIQTMSESIENKLTSNIDSLSETISGTSAPFHSLKEGLSDHIDGITAPFKEAMEDVGEKIKNANSDEPIKEAIAEVASELKGVASPILKSIDKINEDLSSEQIYVDLSEINKVNKTLNTLNNKFPIMIKQLERTSDEMVNLSEESAKEYLKVLRKLNSNNLKAIKKLEEFEQTLKEKTGESSWWSSLWRSSKKNTDQVED
tara:strand:+ start:2739 stop:3839 length:1101 start_codon:yes stop_codon:yes gene_type:complete